MKISSEKGNATEVTATVASSELSQTTKKGTIVSNFTSALTIGETSVRQVGSLFSLNDLHRAAGGEAKHEPNQFTRLDQTQALIAEIKSADSRNCIETRRGANGGTYACRELVIAYAAWISAAFHLKVIRVFLAVAAPQPTPYTVQPSDTLNEPQQIALRAMLESNVKCLPHAKQAGAMIKDWSKLKAHFGVPYRQIPAGEFEEALSIVARHVSEWELVDEAPQPASTPQPIADTVRTKAAFDAATRAAAEVQSAVFNAVLEGSEEWKFDRYLLTFIASGSKGTPAYVQQMERGAFVTTWPRLVKDVATGECLSSSAELLDMATACMQRLQQRSGPVRLAA